MSDDEHSSQYGEESDRDSSEISETESYDTEESEDGIMHRVTNLYASRYDDEEVSETDSSYNPTDSEENSYDQSESTSENSEYSSD